MHKFNHESTFRAREKGLTIIIKNCQRIKNPVVLIYAIWRIFLWFARKLIVFFGFGRILIKGKRPAYLSEKIKQDINQKPNVKNIKLPFTLCPKESELPTEITLAGQKFKCDNNRIPWQTKFNDIEDLFALHRWGWILHLLLQSPYKNSCLWVQEELEIWLNKFLNEKQGPIWEAYSVSERIVNGILFFAICSGYLEQKFQDDFIQTIYEHAKFLKNHLEYHGEKETNNHFLNNARALYFAGQFLQNYILSDFGRLIWFNELHKMLTPAGFLREESSHYHFLLTRSILEVYWLAKQTNDIEFAKKLEKQALKMVKQCYFFLVENDKDKKLEIPLIGDVSPDFSPSWLTGVPFSKIAADILMQNGYKLTEQKNQENNWAKLFGSTLFTIQEKRAIERFYIKDSWARVDKNDSTIFFPIKPYGAVNVNYHGHNDLYSFCLYHQGTPIIIDPGRYSFDKTTLGRYGRKANAHNSILIDNKELFILDWFKIFPFWALRQNVRVTYKTANKDFEIIVKTKNMYRTFYIQSKANALIISDRFLNKGKHYIKSFFHLAPRIKVDKINHKKFLLKNNNATFDLEILSNVKTKSVLKNDYFFPAYGQKIPALKIVFNFITTFPKEIKYQITLP